jgi:hypothetical protein
MVPPPAPAADGAWTGVALWSRAGAVGRPGGDGAGEPVARGDSATRTTGYGIGMAKNHGSQVKDDKQYEALRDKGMSKNKAARIANSNAQGSGGSNQASKKGGSSDKYEDRTKDDLQKEAKKVGIEGRSKMDKGELIDALRNH